MTVWDVWEPRGTHKCELPGDGLHENRFAVGTTVRCRRCGRRYKLKHVPSQRARSGGYMTGGLRWVRRYWPWPR